MFTLLCVDDEPAINTLHKILFEIHGYRVILASSGPEALRVLENETVDLVILDYKMPEMTGLELATAIRSKYADMPMVMESAYIDLPPRVLEQVDRYLTKGESPQKILEIVRSLLARRPAER
jgi:CheY-like chemotaxis protein